MIKTMTFPRKLISVTSLVVLLGLTACSGLSTKEQRMLSGGAAGAAGGAALGAITGGSATAGAIIGGAVGTAAGYLFDEHEKSKKNQ